MTATTGEDGGHTRGPRQRLFTVRTEECTRGACAECISSCRRSESKVRKRGRRPHKTLSNCDMRLYYSREKRRQSHEGSLPQVVQQQHLKGKERLSRRNCTPVYVHMFKHKASAQQTCFRATTTTTTTIASHRVTRGWRPFDSLPLPELQLRLE